MREALTLLAAVPVCRNATDTGCVSIPKQDGTALMTNGLNMVYFVLGALAVIIIILAGYQYLTANGEPAKAQKAMQTILYAVIGLVVVVCAFAITNFVFGGMTK